MMRNAQSRHAKSGPLFLLWLILLLLAPMQARSADTSTAPARQVVSLGQATPYQFALYANQALDQPSLPVSRVVIIVHGVKRNADDYFAIGAHLLDAAGYSAADTLLLAPSFMTRKDAGADPRMPLWGSGTWMQGEPAQAGVTGILPFQVLDDLVRYLAQRQRLPNLRQIVLIGHSAGAQLMQRYAAFNDLDKLAADAGISLRYVVSSPSSYVYFDPSRPEGDSFKVPAGTACPGYDNYRYGLGNAPPYLQRQGLSAQQVFARYAARDITYQVGQRDNDPQHRFLDRACGAALQGATRLERQRNFMRYEQFLANKWNIAVNHPQFQVPGAGHDARKLFGADQAARRVLGLP